MFFICSRLGMAPQADGGYKMKTFFLIALAVAGVAPLNAAFAAVHDLKKPLSVHAFKTQCVHFKLEGVTTADPSVGSNNPWFGLAKDHPNFAELFAILLTAKASKQPVTVHTSEGQTACGYASVAAISSE
jgi:hypothetical protein